MHRCKSFLITLMSFMIMTSIPVIAKAQTTSDETLSVPDYVRNLYILGLILIGVVAFARLVFAGYQYMFGGANANLLSSAKTAFWDVAAGITVLVCGLLILRTINPNILNLRWSVLTFDFKFIKDAARQQCKDKSGRFDEDTWECDTAAPALDDLELYSWGFACAPDEACHRQFSLIPECKNVAGMPCAHGAGRMYYSHGSYTGQCHVVYVCQPK